MQTRKDQKKQTRQKLLAAAKEEFIEKGLAPKLYR